MTEKAASPREVIAEWMRATWVPYECADGEARELLEALRSRGFEVVPIWTQEEISQASVEAERLAAHFDGPEALRACSAPPRE